MSDGVKLPPLPDLHVYARLVDLFHDYARAAVALNSAPVAQNDSLGSKFESKIKERREQLKHMKDYSPPGKFSAATAEVLKNWLSNPDNYSKESADARDTRMLNWLEARESGQRFHNIDRISSVNGKFNGFASLREAIAALATDRENK